MRWLAVEGRHIGQHLHGDDCACGQRLDSLGDLDVALARGHGAQATASLAGCDAEHRAIPREAAFDELRPVPLPPGGRRQARGAHRQPGMRVAHQPVQPRQCELEEGHLV